MMGRTWTEEQKQKQRELLAKKRRDKLSFTHDKNKPIIQLPEPTKISDIHKIIDQDGSEFAEIQNSFGDWVKKIVINKEIKGNKMFLVSTVKNNKIINADDVRYIELANQKTILFFFKSIGNASTGWVYETVEARDKDWEKLQSL